MSETRKRYFVRLVLRCVVFVLCCGLYALRREEFAVLEGWNFFRKFSLLHLLWLVWEVCIMMYPERFWDKSNAALKCSECTDKLCTQYCQKLRK